MVTFFTRHAELHVKTCIAMVLMDWILTVYHTPWHFFAFCRHLPFYPRHSSYNVHSILSSYRYIPCRKSCLSFYAFTLHVGYNYWPRLIACGITLRRPCQPSLREHSFLTITTLTIDQFPLSSQPK